MKNNIELPVNDLKAALSGFSKIVSRRSALPVLSSIKATRDRNGAVTLEVTDLDSYASYKLPFVQSGEPVEFLVPFEALQKRVKTIKDAISLYQEEKGAVILRTLFGNTPMEDKHDSIDLKEWPIAPTMPAPSLKVDETFKSAFKQAFECSSFDESRLVLNSVFLDVEDKKAHYVVATNGRILFSANSFSFDLKESLMIPNRKFLGWNGWWLDGNAQVAVKPPAGDKPGWIQFAASQWTFTTRAMDGVYPNWKQVLPGDKARTVIHIPEEAIASVLEVIARIPGDEEPNNPVTLNVDTDCLVIQGRNKRQDQVVSVPIPAATITGGPSAVCLNREILAKALRFGLNEIQIVDELSPVVLKAGGRRVVIAPVRLEHSPAPSPEPAEQTNTSTNPSFSCNPPSAEPEINQRKDMKTETAAATADEPQAERAESPIKKAMQEAETIKDTLKGVIAAFHALLDALRKAEKEKRATEKEVESIRATLRQIQSVRI